MRRKKSENETKKQKYSNFSKDGENSSIRCAVSILIFHKKSQFIKKIKINHFMNHNYHRTPCFNLFIDS
jgi:hypothetical protein